MLRKLPLLLFLLALALTALPLRTTGPEREVATVDEAEPVAAPDFSAIPLEAGLTRYTGAGFVLDYPDTWKLRPGSEEETTRLLLTSPASTINIYALPRDGSVSLIDWIRSTQSAWFDNFDFVEPGRTLIGGQEAIVTKYCETALSYSAYIAGADRNYLVWATGSETDFREALIRFYPGPMSTVTSLPEQFAVHDEPACHPSTDSGPEPDPATVCDYSETAQNSCCSQFSDREVPYWSCSENFTGDYGNCTWWAAYMRPEVGAAAADHPGHGNACNWDYWAFMDGFLVDDCPREGDIFVYDVQGCPGHVASVEQVLWDTGKISVSEMNWCSTCLRTKEYLNRDRKFVHSQKPEVVIYPDPPNAVADQFAAAGACNGKPDFHTSEPGVYTVNPVEVSSEAVPAKGDAAAVHIPDGWSVRLRGYRDGEEVCMGTSGLLAGNIYSSTGMPVEDAVREIEVFDISRCGTW
ncbi:hypothetical protein AUK40_02930 [Candidatus Wirthbacteria bacterium CG2_30_54_11]|uniref:Peptidase C51 domain-containing protein n=1 Tax=Candidatus Wirthbacteria bacterium CG2_30_54_11 TaxID=1817892 RepID=A0A1J5IWL6_9BACT|nr:MAG: hypothetical protein AUK40_02930 [Candidatus Wirthbacteria bacterium CG2_30_54_11]